MTSKFIKIAHINIRSLVNKIEYVRLFIAENSIDILSVTETWLSAPISNDLIRIDNYVFFRNDRVGRGGGVGVFVRNCFSCSVIDSSHQIEQLWLLVKVGIKKIAVGTVYNPPHLDYKSFLGIIEDSFINCHLLTDELYCLGDFNIDLFGRDQPAVNYFNYFLDGIGAKQIINDFTRITDTTSTLLDLILVTDDAAVVDCGVLNCHVSDHDFVYCCVAGGISKNNPVTHTFRDYKNFSREEFRSDLCDVDFNELIYLDNINDKITMFNFKIMQLFDKHAPFITRRFTKRNIPWLSDNLKYMMNLRDGAKSTFRRTGRQSDWEYYKSLRNLTNRTFTLEKKAYYNFISRSRDKKSLWKELNYLGLKKKHEYNIPDGLGDPDAVNNYFIDSVPRVGVATSLARSSQYPFGEFNFTLATVELISEIINNIESTAAGHDGININMLRMCCPLVIPYVTHIINSCILQNEFPRSWKLAVVVPIPKVTNVCEFKDFRPISILPLLSKIFERVLQVQVKRFIETHGLLPDVQSGFRAGRSCTTALLCVTDDLLGAMDKGLVTALILLDYSRAFDTVNHSTLLDILAAGGFGGDALHLLTDYLSDRSQYVKIGPHSSQPRELHQGVPQGAILSPILFSLYTSSFVNDLKYTKAHMYADDIQLYYSFEMSDWEQSVARINGDLSHIFNISTMHSLSLNPTKSRVLLFGNREACESLGELANFNIDNQPIPIVNKAKNLGLNLDNSFRFRDQITKYLQSAYLNLKKLYPHRSVLNSNIKKSMCDMFVLSNFTYCSEIYHPCLDVITANRIQKVQNSCLRFIYGIKKYQRISHKLRDAGWLNMGSRRELQLMTLFHKILITKNPPYLYNKITFRTDVHNISTRFRGLISPPPHRKALYERSFSYCVYNKYNVLPGALKQTTNVRKFKFRLRSMLFSG